MEEQGEVDPTHPLSFIHEEGGGLDSTAVTALSRGRGWAFRGHLGSHKLTLTKSCNKRSSRFFGGSHVSILSSEKLRVTGADDSSTSHPQPRAPGLPWQTSRE